VLEPDEPTAMPPASQQPGSDPERPDPERPDPERPDPERPDPERQSSETSWSDQPWYVPATPPPTASAQRWDQPPVFEVPSDQPPWQPPIPSGTGWLAAPQPTLPPQRTRRWPIIASALAVLLAVVLGGGGIVAYRALHGGGTQPEQVLPADTFAFAKLDLNPSASQKIAAVRFLGKIPHIGSSFDQSKDPRRSLFDLIASGGNLPTDLSYDRDIKPWLGNRIAIGVRPGMISTASPDVIIAIQASDESKARVGLQKIASRFSGGQIGIAFRNGYALLTQRQDMADRAAADAAQANLAGATNFHGDMTVLGQQGIASGWMDYSQLRRVAGGLFPGQSAALSSTAAYRGRMSYALRFSGKAVEMVIKVQGAGTRTSVASAGSRTLAELPSTTAAGVELVGANSKVDSLWKQFKASLAMFGSGATSGSAVSAGGVAPGSPVPAVPGAGRILGSAPSADDMISSFQHQFGIRLPGDLTTLLGSDLVISLDSASLVKNPKFGVRSRTNGVAAAAVLAAIKKAAAAQHQDLPLSWAQTSDGIVASNDPGYRAELSQPVLTSLGAQQQFRDAVPDASRSVVTAYANLTAIAAEMKKSGATASDLKTVEAFSALGLTTTIDGDVSTLRIRLLAH
jgi:hypothetical protein